MDKGQSVSCGEALTALGFVGLCIAFGLHYPKDSQDWAAWMQAFGSIAAIAGAGWIARGQVREAKRVEGERREAQRNVEAEGRKEQLRAIAVFVDQLFITLDKTADQLNDQGFPHEMVSYASVRMAPLQVSIAALSEIPLHQLPNAYIGVQVLNIRNCAAHVVRILESIEKTAQPVDAKGMQWLMSATGVVAGYRDRARSDLEKLWAHTDAYDGIRSPVVLARDLQAPS